MKFWNRKNKIEFFHNEPSIIDTFPIMESKDLKLNWANKARQDFQNLIKEGAGNNPEFSHLARCPGIFDLFKYGYVISLHKDILIKRKDIGFEWQFKYPRDHRVGNLPSKLNDFEITSPTEANIKLISIPPWADNFIVKIDTGWHVIAPKGLKFIMLPIAYPDTFDFTSSIGILNPAVATDINFQMFWHAKEDIVTIKAGTPLGHLIPLSEKKYQMVQRNMNQRDRRWVEKMTSAYNSTFWNHTMRKKIVDMYNKYWKR